MIDLLDPVAKEARLTGNVQRARRFLASQIEDGGLVRYHGRPEAVGSLGCRITPDAEDTALVWRIAPGNRELVTDGARDSESIPHAGRPVSTWLAPPRLYQCIDPGKDPNPADVAIQMHVLMFLAKGDPPAAHISCQTLRRTMTADRIWAPHERLRLVRPCVSLTCNGQSASWNCRRRGYRLRCRSRPFGSRQPRCCGELHDRRPPPAPASAAVIELLQGLSRDDFSVLRRTPPLLYHNDLTASVPRFYWSEEMGYALGLRLRREYAPSFRRRSDMMQAVHGNSAARTRRRRPFPHLLSCIRFDEVLILQGSPLLGALFSMGRLTVANAAAVGLLVAGSTCLVAHVFVLNDWSGMNADLRDPNRTSRVFINMGVARARIGHLWMALLALSLLLLGALSWRSLIIAVVIAGLSALYSAPAAHIKGVPVLNSALHFAGGLLHFLLGYSVFRAPDGRGIEIGCFCGTGIHRGPSDP